MQGALRPLGARWIEDTNGSAPRGGGAAVDKGKGKEKEREEPVRDALPGSRFGAGGQDGVAEGSEPADEPAFRRAGPSSSSFSGPSSTSAADSNAAASTDSNPDPGASSASGDLVVQAPVPGLPPLSPHRLPVRRVPFSTRRFVRDLERSGIERALAEEFMRATKGMLRRHEGKAQEDVLNRQDLENEAYLFQAALSELKTGSQVKLRNDSITLRSLTANLQRETDGLEQKMKEDMQRLGSDIQLEMNTRKEETGTELQSLDKRVMDLNSKFTILLSEVRTEIESTRWVSTRRVMTAITITVVGLVGYFSVNQSNKSKQQQQEQVAAAAAAAAGGSGASGAPAAAGGGGGGGGAGNGANAAGGGGGGGLAPRAGGGGGGNGTTASGLLGPLSTNGQSTRGALGAPAGSGLSHPGSTPSGRGTAGGAAGLIPIPSIAELGVQPTENHDPDPSASAAAILFDPGWWNAGVAAAGAAANPSATTTGSSGWTPPTAAPSESAPGSASTATTTLTATATGGAEDSSGDGGGRGGGGRFSWLRSLWGGGGGGESSSSAPESEETSSASPAPSLSSS
ncbi:hypothetical protein JCM8202v2_003101 [Rhodotorula sphaerocarpa]